MQLSKSMFTIADSIINIVENEGLLSLFSGIGPAALYYMLEGSLKVLYHIYTFIIISLVSMKALTLC